MSIVWQRVRITRCLRGVRRSVHTEREKMTLRSHVYYVRYVDSSYHPSVKAIDTAQGSDMKHIQTPRTDLTKSAQFQENEIISIIYCLKSTFPLKAYKVKHCHAVISTGTRRDVLSEQRSTSPSRTMYCYKSIHDDDTGHIAAPVNFR